MAIHLANLSRELDDEIGTKKLTQAMPSFVSGIDLGYAKSMSICGLGMLADCVLLNVG